MQSEPSQEGADGAEAPGRLVRLEISHFKSYRGQQVLFTSWTARCPLARRSEPVHSLLTPVLSAEREASALQRQHGCATWLALLGRGRAGLISASNIIPCSSCSWVLWS